jgi:hypothetical protein
MLMRISTLGRKKIFQVFAFLAFFAGLTKSSAQCPTVINPNQTFCDIQSPTVANLVATNSGEELDGMQMLLEEQRYQILQG